MIPNPKFLRQRKVFWANIRTISEKAGYTYKKQVKVHDLDQIVRAYTSLGLGTEHIADPNGSLTKMGRRILDYLKYRAEVLNSYVEPRLMTYDEAAALYEELKSRYKPKCPPPMNKQSNEKKTISYFTAMINMVIEAYGNGLDCEFDPQKLTASTYLLTTSKFREGISSSSGGCFTTSHLRRLT